MHFKYEILFSIEILLEGYEDIHENDIDIYADADTLTLLPKQRMLEKGQNNIFNILVEVIPTGDVKDTMITELDDDKALTFHLKFKHEKFQNFYSNLTSYDLEKNIFSFSNHVVSKNGTVLHLTKSLAAYDSVATYSKGYLVRETGKNYQAKETHTNKPTSDTNFWKEIADDYYVSQNDLVLRSAVSADIPRNVFGIVQISNYETLNADYLLIERTNKMVEGVNTPVQIPNKKKFTLQFKTNIHN
jgi:hypothetical protein